MFAMKPAGPETEEPVFSSSEVSELAAITLRQLQWWDERKIISPRKEGHRRLYSLPQVLEIMTAGELRHKGLSLQKVRRIVRLLRRRLEASEHLAERRQECFVLTDGRAVHIEHQADRVIRLMGEASGPMYLISLREPIERLAGGAARSRQLKLF
jgi:DNA-binding transcriptional MerR regulator